MKSICRQCNKEFELNTNQIRTINKYPDKPLFCSVKCSGKYYTIKQHSNETEEQKQIKNKKISDTLKSKEMKLTEEQKQARVSNLNNYWSNFTSEQRSQINKNSAVKAKETKLKKYGNANYNNQEKIKETNLEKYGVSTTLRTDKAISKAKQAIKDKYGVEYFFCNREQFKSVSLAKYGVEHPMQNESVKDKLSNTKFINWNDKNYNSEKCTQTFINRYGIKRPFQMQRFIDKANKTKKLRYGNKNYNNREKAMKTLYEKYGEDYYNKQLSNIGNRISKINKKFAEYIGTNEFEFPVGKYSYDLKVGDTLIEINPIFTHNSAPSKLYGRFGSLDKMYHYNKTFIAQQVGYRCIHVFDWDDWEKIKYLIQDK